MKPIFWVFVAILLSPFVVTAGIYATEITPEQLSQFQTFVESIKGSKGVGQMSLSVIVVQALMYVLKENFPKMKGNHRILILQALTVIVGMIGLRFGDFDLASAFTHANTLGAIQVFLYQLWKQFTEAEEKYSLPAVK